MKIVFTAEHAGDLSAFHQLGELLVEGWALGKPKLSAGQLIELAHDAEVLVTSYDEVTDAVMAACPRLLLCPEGCGLLVKKILFRRKKQRL